MSENDSQLELKKRARRRLVGAIALALLAAIVLPMVMDQEPKPVAQDIQIRIPNQDAGSFTSRILPVKPGSTPTPLPPATVPEAKPQPAVKPDTPAAKAEPPKSEPAKPEPPKAASTASLAAAAPKQPELRAAAPADEKLLAKKPEEAKSEKAPAKPGPKANGKTDQTRAEAALNGGEQWIVQIGAYRDPTNVRNLQAKLKEQGYNFYTEPLVSDGVKKTRVRAGPFPSKEAAEKAREKLKRIGVDGVVAQK